MIGGSSGRFYAFRIPPTTGPTVRLGDDQRHYWRAPAERPIAGMHSNAVVTIEELDTQGHVWRTFTSHMVRASVEHSLAAIRAGYNMDRTRIKVDGEVVDEPRRR